jgi:hypothetical protein
MAEKSAARGESVQFNSSSWSDGAYEFRYSTRRARLEGPISRQVKRSIEILRFLDDADTRM